MKKLFLLIFLCSVNDLLKAQTLTRREVFDLQVGDELGISVSFRGRTLQWLKVIQREEVGMDSVVISFYRRQLAFKMEGNVLSVDTLVMHEGRLSEPYFKNFEQMDTFVIDSVFRSNSFQLRDTAFNDACGTLFNERLRNESTEAYTENRTTRAYKGLGVYVSLMTFSGGPFGPEYDVETLEYYVKNGDTCGNVKDFPLSIQSSSKEPYWHLYPNPSIGELMVSGCEIFQYILYDNKGEAVKHGDSIEQEPINVQELSAGLYFLLVFHEGQSKRFMFYVQN